MVGKATEDWAASFFWAQGLMCALVLFSDMSS